MDSAQHSRDNIPVRGARLAGFALLIAGLALDQASKAWALNTLEGHPAPLLGSWLSLELVHNSGGAFSLLDDHTWFFTVVAVVVSVALIIGLARARTFSWSLPLGLLGAGAIGNLIDRLIRPPSFGSGHVVDFINYHGWFVGNVADIWIVVAVIWLGILMVVGTRDD